jgi:hypothetical protein
MPHELARQQTEAIPGPGLQLVNPRLFAEPIEPLTLPGRVA